MQTRTMTAPAGSPPATTALEVRGLTEADDGRTVVDDVDGAGLEQRLRFTTTATLDEDWIRRLPEVSGVARDHGEFVVTGDERMLFSVVSLLAAHDIVPARLQVDQPSLDDAFVALAGRSLDGTSEVARRPQARP